MKTLLISTYELGRQPVHIASPRARIEAAGHEVRTLDLAVESWDAATVDWADAIAFSTPMHTAMRLAVGAALAVRRRRPDVPIASYGLYAATTADDEDSPFDVAFVGEYEHSLIEWLSGGSPGERAVATDLGRGGFRTPVRVGLPSLDRYARLLIDDAERLVGAVEASHGCLHRCRHCPIPAVYDGRLRIVDTRAVLADIDQQVAAGAGHITFGDPDFLNGPAHSLRIVRAMHDRHPDVTFDCTVKVEHILKYDDVWPEFAEAGCVFVVSAFESMNDDVLSMLDKGHTAADAARAVHLLRSTGIDIRPSWLPFTPWTTRDDIDAMFRFISAHDLIASTDPVQMGIRLLIPPGSLMLDIDGIDRFLAGYDAAALSYQWVSDDPAMDALSARLMAIAERAAAESIPTSDVFREQWLAVVEDSDLEAPAVAIGQGATVGRPKLTESWFC